jgi:ribosome assembly protein RRB1
MTSYLVAGSQAPKHDENKIYIMKMSNLQKTSHDDQSDDDDSSVDGDDEAILEYKTIPHKGGINRIRVIALLM